MIIFNLVRAFEVVKLLLDLYYIKMSHDGDKSSKNNFLINN